MSKLPANSDAAGLNFVNGFAPGTALRGNT
jgi:hypothetical protein